MGASGSHTCSHAPTAFGWSTGARCRLTMWRSIQSGARDSRYPPHSLLHPPSPGGHSPLEGLGAREPHRDSLGQRAGEPSAWQAALPSNRRSLLYFRRGARTRRRGPNAASDLAGIVFCERGSIFSAPCESSNVTASVRNSPPRFSGLRLLRLSIGGLTDMQFSRTVRSQNLEW